MVYKAVGRLKGIQGFYFFFLNHIFQEFLYYNKVTYKIKSLFTLTYMVILGRCFHGLCGIVERSWTLVSLQEILHPVLNCYMTSGTLLTFLKFPEVVERKKPGIVLGTQYVVLINICLFLLSLNYIVLIFQREKPSSEGHLQYQDSNACCAWSATAFGTVPLLHICRMSSAVDQN